TRQGIAVENAGDAGVAFGEGEHQQQDLLALRRRLALVLDDARDAREQGVLDKADQSFEHARLAGEVAVERRFRDADLFRQGRGGDAPARLVLQHARQGLQYLLPAGNLVGEDHAQLLFERLVICVPMPLSVKTSSSTAWGIRPSIICALFTPEFTASR